MGNGVRDQDVSEPAGARGVAADVLQDFGADEDFDGGWGEPGPEDEVTHELLDIGVLWHEAREKGNEAIEKLVLEIKEYLVAVRQGKTGDTVGQQLLFQHRTSDRRLTLKVRTTTESQLCYTLQAYVIDQVCDENLEIFSFLAYELLSTCLAVLIDMREALESDDEISYELEEPRHELIQTLNNTLEILAKYGSPREMYTMFLEFLALVKAPIGESIRPWIGRETLVFMTIVLPRLEGSKISGFFSEALGETSFAWMTTADESNLEDSTNKHFDVFVDLLHSLTTSWKDRSGEDALLIAQALRKYLFEALTVLYTQSPIHEKSKPASLSQQHRRWAGDILAILDALGVESASHILGYSFAPKLFEDNCSERLAPGLIAEPIPKAESLWPLAGPQLALYSLYQVHGFSELHSNIGDQVLSFTLLLPCCLVLLGRSSDRIQLCGLELAEELLDPNFVREMPLFGPDMAFDGPYKERVGGQTVNLLSLVSRIAGLTTKSPVQTVRSRAFKAIQSIVGLCKVDSGLRVEMNVALIHEVTTSQRLRLVALLIGWTKTLLLQVDAMEQDSVTDRAMDILLPRWLEPRQELVYELETVTAAANVALFYTIRLINHRREPDIQRQKFLLSQLRAAKEAIEIACGAARRHQEAAAEAKEDVAAGEVQALATSTVHEGRVAMSAIEYAMSLFPRAGEVAPRLE